MTNGTQGPEISPNIRHSITMPVHIDTCRDCTTEDECKGKGCFWWDDGTCRQTPQLKKVPPPPPPPIN